MIVAADSFFDSSTWDVMRNLAFVLAVVFWARDGVLGLQGRAAAHRGSVARRDRDAARRRSRRSSAR